MAEQTKAALKSPQQRDSESKRDNPANPSPAVSTPPAAMSWVEQADTYLNSKGWEKIGSDEYGIGIWQDPGGSLIKPTPSTIVMLPAAGGGMETIRQMTGPPCPWEYRTAEAVRIQRLRDTSTQESGGTPLERLGRLEQRYNSLQDAHERLIAVVKHILNLPAPTKPEGYNAIRGILAEGLGQVLQETVA